MKCFQTSALNRLSLSPSRRHLISPNTSHPGGEQSGDKSTAWASEQVHRVWCALMTFNKRPSRSRRASRSLTLLLMRYYPESKEFTRWNPAVALYNSNEVSQVWHEGVTEETSDSQSPSCCNNERAHPAPKLNITQVCSLPSEKLPRGNKRTDKKKWLSDATILTFSFGT